MYTLVLGVHVYNEIILMDSIQQARLAQSVEHQTSNLRVVNSSSAVGKNFSFCILSFSTRSWQVGWSHTNEIKHDVHPRYIVQKLTNKVYHIAMTDKRIAGRNVASTDGIEHERVHSVLAEGLTVSNRSVHWLLKLIRSPPGPGALWSVLIIR